MWKGFTIFLQDFLFGSVNRTGDAWKLHNSAYFQSYNTISSYWRSLYAHDCSPSPHYKNNIVSQSES